MGDARRHLRHSPVDGFPVQSIASVAQPTAGWLRDVTGHPAMPVFCAAHGTIETVACLVAFQLVDRASGAAAWGGMTCRAN